MGEFYFFILFFYYDSANPSFSKCLYDFSIKRHATSGVLADDVLILGICL